MKLLVGALALPLLLSACYSPEDRAAAFRYSQAELDAKHRRRIELIQACQASPGLEHCVTADDVEARQRRLQAEKRRLQAEKARLAEEAAERSAENDSRFFRERSQLETEATEAAHRRNLELVAARLELVERCQITPNLALCECPFDNPEPAEYRLTEPGPVR